MTNSRGANTSDGEDDLRLPASWSRQLLPARGKRLGTSPRLDKGAPERVREDLERFDQRLRQAFARTENQHYAGAALAYLDGADDPRGAGAVATLMTYTRREGPTSKLRPELDAWILERGLPFAVCAAIETAAIGAWRTDRGSRAYGPETRTTKVDAGKIVGMTKRGWRRAAPEDAGVEPGVCFDLPEDGHVLIGLEPGIYVGDIASTPEQTLETVHLSHREDYWVHRPGEDAPHPSDIDPVTASEVLATLARVTGRN